MENNAGRLLGPGYAPKNGRRGKDFDADLFDANEGELRRLVLTSAEEIGLVLPSKVSKVSLDVVGKIENLLGDGEEILFDEKFLKMMWSVLRDPYGLPIYTRRRLLQSLFEMFL